VPRARPAGSSREADLSSAPDEVIRLMVTSDGFVAATAADVVRYELVGGMPRVVAAYSTKDGLPRGRCLKLLTDARGGIWAAFEAGVAYLPKGGSRWRSFTAKNGLPGGEVKEIALSAKGDRVWVATEEGLATTALPKLAWRQFKKGLIEELCVAPSGDLVGCVQEVRGVPGSCGPVPLATCFDLRSEKWTDLPDRRERLRPVGSIRPWTKGRLWLLSGDEPPMVAEPSTGNTRTWPTAPNWEHKGGERTVYESFGDLLPSATDPARLWLATSAGLWLYDAEADAWTPHTWVKEQGWSKPLVAMTRRGERIYWLLSHRLAAFDVASGTWTPLGEDKAWAEAVELQLSPDEGHLWIRTLSSGHLEKRILVFDLASRTLHTLTAGETPGYRQYGRVQFHPGAQVALIPSDLGVVLADYSGKVRSVFRRTDCAIDLDVHELRFSPDGGEVWCRMGQVGYPVPHFCSRAAVFRPREGRWLAVPEPGTGHFLRDVAFSADGKTTWVSVGSLSGKQPGVMVRTEPGGAWKPEARMPPSHDPIEDFWLTPKKDELWMHEGSVGLLRLKLASGELTWYSWTDRNEHPGLRKFDLSNFWVKDLVFTPDGKMALCAAGATNYGGLTIIDLASGEPTCFRGLPEAIRRITITPDGKTAWCLLEQRSHLWAMDIPTRTWTHKLLLPNDMYNNVGRALLVSPDGRFVWVASSEGMVVYSVAEGKWTVFAKRDDPFGWPWCLSRDGRRLLCRHERGLAVARLESGLQPVSAPLNRQSALRPEGRTPNWVPIGGRGAECGPSHIVAVPGTERFVLAVEHEDVGGIYVFDLATRALRRLKAIEGERITALALDPTGRVWAATARGLVCPTARIR
jgi:hypothetical protein